jgi:Membrane protein involved in colicin uptake
MNKKCLSFGITHVKFEGDSRLNWLPFKGTCLFTDTPSDGIPSGGLDKPVAFPQEEVQKALSTMTSMGINCRFPDDFWDGPAEVFSGHDSRFKIGVVETPVLNGNEMVISGGLWDNDFPDVCYVYRNAKESLGFSVEVYFDPVDMGEYYNAVNVEFTGVAVLFADLAAFKKTYIAAQEKHKGGMKMNEELLKKMLGEFTASISKTISDNIEGVKAEFAQQIETLSSEVSKVNAELAAAKAEKEAGEQAAKEAAELAAKKAAEEAAAAEAEAKAKAELEAKQKEEAKKLEVQRKSMAFGRIQKRFAGDNDKQKAILSDATLSPSEKFQDLLQLREVKAAE